MGEKDKDSRSPHKRAMDGWDGLGGPLPGGRAGWDLAMPPAPEAASVGGGRPIDSRVYALEREVGQLTQSVARIGETVEAGFRETRKLIDSVHNRSEELIREVDSKASASRHANWPAIGVIVTIVFGVFAYWYKAENKGITDSIASVHDRAVTKDREIGEDVRRLDDRHRADHDEVVRLRTVEELRRWGVLVK